MHLNFYFLNNFIAGFKANSINNAKKYHLYVDTYVGKYDAIKIPKNMQLSFTPCISHIFIFLIFLSIHFIKNHLIIYGKAVVLIFRVMVIQSSGVQYSWDSSVFG